MLVTVGALIVVLGVLIFVHEAGHFVAAKAMGIQVLRFSLGFGRPIFTVRRGETEYGISWLPIGGYVKMAGLEDDSWASAIEGGQAGPIDPARAFDRKPVWQRLVVILAGVTMNFVFAVVVYSGLAYFGVLEPDRLATTAVDQIRPGDLPAVAAPLAVLSRGDRILTINGDSVMSWGELEERLVTAPAPVTLGVTGHPPIVIPFAPGDSAGRFAVARALRAYLPPVVAQVEVGTPGARAGIHPGDRIVRVNGDTIASWEDFHTIVRARPDQELTLLLQRDTGTVTVRVVPERRMETDPETKAQHAIGVVGVVAVHPMLKAPGAIGAVALGWRETTNKVSVILAFLKRPRVQELGGPLTIGEVSGQAARVGFAFFLSFMAFLSVNLAVLNLLPIPILDGGQVVFLVAELVRRRPLSVELRARLTQIGFVVLVSIMLIALRNDVLRVFPRVFGR